MLYMPLFEGPTATVQIFAVAMWLLDNKCVSMSKYELKQETL